MAQDRQLFIHVGLQKTGTSYLQAALLASTEPLAAAGLDLVPPTKAQCFELMVVVRDRYASRRDPESDRNTLERFSAQLREARGSRAVLSQESLAAATPDQVDRLISASEDREVHVVLTARDLGRQLPSAWQEHLKAGGTTDLERYLRRLQDLQRAGAARGPWIHLDPAAVLARWARRVPAERIHLVTVPPPGSDPTLLLERFSHVLGVDAATLTPEARRSNSSLGRVQAEVLREVNAGLPEDVHRRWIYGDVVKRSFSSGVLAAQGGRPILVPEELRPWCDAVTADQAARLTAAGYQVVGDLADLTPAASAFGPAGLAPTRDEVATAAVDALTTVLTARGRRHAERRTGRIEVPPVTGGRRDRVLALVRRLDPRGRRP